MNNKEEEEILRKQAIVLHLQGLSVQEISSQLNRSRQWVYKWIKRHSASPEKENWHQAHSNAPKNIRNRIPNETETAIINIRKELESNPYHQNGAVNIFYKLNEAGIKPPSTGSSNATDCKTNHAARCGKTQNIRQVSLMYNKWI